eukprot:524062-Rhodomonas_salina.2
MEGFEAGNLLYEIRERHEKIYTWLKQVWAPVRAFTSRRRLCSTYARHPRAHRCSLINFSECTPEIAQEYRERDGSSFLSAAWRRRREVGQCFQRFQIRSHHEALPDRVPLVRCGQTRARMARAEQHSSTRGHSSQSR